ncbi:MAG: hypothetical protein ACR2LM_00870 [Pyrinomonadaceae bacterium]
MARTLHTRNFTAEEEHQQQVGKLISSLISGDKHLDSLALIKSLIEVCEKGEPCAFSVTFQPLRLKDMHLIVISTESGQADTNFAIEYSENSTIPWNEVCLPPNFAYRLLCAVAQLIQTERKLAVADEALQTAEVIEEFRNNHVSYHKAYINERLGISRGRIGDYDLTPLPFLYHRLLPVWQHAKKVFRSNSSYDTWRETVTREIEDKLKSAKLNQISSDKLSSDKITELVGRLAGLSAAEQQKLKDRKLKASPGDLALDHAALICGVPLYHYTLRHLQDNSKRKLKSRTSPFHRS